MNKTTKSVVYSESELRVLYAVQVLVEKRRTYYVAGRLERTLFYQNKTIQMLVERVLDRFPRLGIQLGLLLKMYRPAVFKKMVWPASNEDQQLQSRPPSSKSESLGVSELDHALTE